MTIIAQTAETAKEIINMVDKASVANDRWLFIAALAILLGFAGIVIRWLVSSIETKDAAHSADRKIMDAEIKAERTESRAQRKEDQLAFMTELHNFSIEIKSLTEAQRKNTEILIAHDKEMRESHSIQIKDEVYNELVRRGIVATPHIGS